MNTHRADITEQLVSGVNFKKYCTHLKESSIHYKESGIHHLGSGTLLNEKSGALIRKNDRL